MKKTIIIILSALMAFSFSAAAVDSSVSSELTDKKPAKKAKGELKEVTFNVHLHCASCVKKVQENLSYEKGVKDLKVSLENQTVYVKFDASKNSEQALKAVLEKLGVPVTEKCCEGHDHHHHHNNK